VQASKYPCDFTRMNTGTLTLPSLYTFQLGSGSVFNMLRAQTYCH